MNCQEVDELSGAYALRALPPDEMSSVAAHVAGCARHAELRDLEQSAAAMAFTAPEIEPPPGLRDRIVGAVRAEQQARSSPRLAPEKDQRRGFFSGWSWPRLAPYGFAAALILLLSGLLAADIATRGSDGNNGGTVVLDLQPTSGDASGQIIILEDQGIAIVQADGLEPLTEDQTYQMWALTDGEPTGIGLFAADTDGSASSIVEVDLSNADAGAVTIEPAGGSELPTTEPILATDL
ncbi:MAG: anti-sigma factor [Dehalococcoidia bacterium]